MVWQARRDSNPQHPDLESGALPLELLAYVRLFCFLVYRVSPAKAAIFLEGELLRFSLLVSHFRVVSLLTFRACKRYNVGRHGSLFLLRVQKYSLSIYSMMSMTTPAPTVRPPSRMANRSSFSRATGVIKSTVISMLSPGITISTPSGNFNDPVTSVVRK